MVLISGKNRAIYLLSLLTKRKEKINIYRPGLADMIRGMTIIPRSMSARTLFDKVWDAHTVKILPSGQTQLFIGLHLVHEVTSPQENKVKILRQLSSVYCFLLEPLFER